MQSPLSDSALKLRLLPQGAKAGLCVALLVTAACTRVPEIEGQLTENLRAQPYPDLLPLERALRDQPLPEVAVTEVQDDLDARARRLKARADALRKRNI